ncbi:hypothetical protein VTI74DRAFT_1304 [Chaetomium olivicolor]
MRVLRRSSGWALLCLYLLSGLVAAGALPPSRRQEPDIAASSSPRPTPTNDEQKPTNFRTSPPTLEPTGAATISITISTSHRPSPTPTPTSLNDANLFNETLPSNQLPLSPEITPGWAVAGTLLLATGLVYGLLGIRAKRMQTFFSTAFLASLGTTVLILYLMTPPATHAVQGAFVVAAVCTGAALGGLAVLFRDVAEGLSCLLGGLSLAMWLLTLREGGLVQSGSGKVVFIAVLAAAGFCLYFSRWTRDWGMVGCIAFSGATVVVLGIDCFSRAGLKEFWAYIWQLNDRLFPSGAVTYPLTKGIKVELAVTVILFVLGIVSQMKLWRLIRERRNKGSKESSDGEQALPDEEENIGRQVEEATNRERREWERVYGDGASVHTEPTESGVGETEGEKRKRGSERTSATTLNEGQPIELPLEADQPAGVAEEKVEVEGIIGKDEAAGRVVVKVVADDAEGVIRNPTPEGEREKEGTLKSSASTIRSSTSGAEPAIVPLPFKIPTANIEETEAALDKDDRSSVAAVADDEEDSPEAVDEESKRHVPAGLSGHSATQPQSSMHQEGDTGVAAERYAALAQLIGSKRDDSDSIIATLDDESSNEDADTAILDWPPQGHEDTARRVGEEKPEESGPVEQQDAPIPTTELAAHLKERSNMEPTVLGERDQPTIIGEKSTTDQQEVVTPAPEAASSKDATDAPKGSKGSESTESFRTVLARLTKPNLPPALPEVAMIYRTNEWAKHLGLAETPEPDALQLPEPEPIREEPAPLNIHGLQQTAETGAPPPAAPRASSAMSNYAPPRPVARSASRASLSGSEIGTFSPAAPSQDLQAGTKPSHYRSSSIMKRQSPVVLAAPIAEEHEGETLGVDNAHAVQTAGLASVNHRISASMSTPNLALQLSNPAYAYSTPQTLIGMREMLLRSRVSGIFTHHDNTAMHHLTDQRPPHLRRLFR